MTEIYNEEYLDEGLFSTNLDRKNGTQKIAQKVSKRVNKIKEKTGKEPRITVKRITPEEYEKYLKKKNLTVEGITTVTCIVVDIVGTILLTKLGGKLASTATKGAIKGVSKVLSSKAGAAATSAAVTSVAGTAVDTVNKKKNLDEKNFFYQVDLTAKGNGEEVHEVVLLKCKSEFDARNKIVQCLQANNLKAYKEALELFESYNNL